MSFDFPGFDDRPVHTRLNPHPKSMPENKPASPVRATTQRIAAPVRVLSSDPDIMVFSTDRPNAVAQIQAMNLQTAAPTEKLLHYTKDELPWIGAFARAVVLDSEQTATWASKGVGELNPLLRPFTQRPNDPLLAPVMAAEAMIGIYAVGQIKDTGIRKILLIGGTLLEAAVVYWNNMTSWKPSDTHYGRPPEYTQMFTISFPF